MYAEYGGGECTQSTGLKLSMSYDTESSQPDDGLYDTKSLQPYISICNPVSILVEPITPGGLENLHTTTT